MKNKKKILYIILFVAVVVFLGLYILINYTEPNVLSSEDKKWISDNGGKVIDIAVVNDIPVYANNGSGVIFDYLEYVHKETNLEFNKVPYLKNNTTNNSAKYKIEIIDGSIKLSSEQLLIYKDLYVAIEKTDRKINDLSDFSNQTIGILNDDSSIITYYLGSDSNITIKNYASVDELFKALDNKEVASIIAPHMMNLDKTIKGDYYINYFFNNISKNVVLTFDSSNKNLNNILTKTYNNWVNKEYNDDYNKTLLEYYMNMRNISDKTKADLLSKIYIYGYVENYPYEFSMAGHMEGVAIEYLKRVMKLTNIDIKFQRYDNIAALKEAIDKGKVDIYFDYFDGSENKYLKAKPVFSSKYVVLGKDYDVIVDNLESLKGKDVNALSNHLVTNYIKSNTKANIIEKDSVGDLKKANLVIVDNEIYSYYKNSKFKDFEVLYSANMSDNYAFKVNGTDSSFFDLFNYFINSNSYYNYRNSAYTSFNGSIFDKVTFEELYLIILAMILVPIIAFIIIRVLLKNKRKLRILKRDDRKKYTDMMTSLKNRNYLNLNIDKWNQNKTYPQAIMVIDLNNTKYINDNYGREKGDLLIVRASAILINTQLENTEIIRSDGNEFLIYMIGYNENQVDIYAKKLSKSLQELPYGFGAAIGYSMIVDNIKTIDDAINEATIAMQSDKESYK